jgi:hypothetical protein
MYIMPTSTASDATLGNPLCPTSHTVCKSFALLEKAKRLLFRRALLKGLPHVVDGHDFHRAANLIHPDFAVATVSGRLPGQLQEVTAIGIYPLNSRSVEMLEHHVRAGNRI